MRKVKFSGFINYANEWGKINSEIAIFDVPDEQNPFDFFREKFTMGDPDFKYLITYDELEE